MKKNLLLIAFCFTGAIAGAINGCKKDAPMNLKNNGSFTEEFIDVSSLTTKGWALKDNSSVDSGDYAYASTQWEQGPAGIDKTGNPYGFPAYSYKSSTDEYAYSAENYSDSNQVVSSWLITPVLSVKNGDKISFYTRGEANSGGRMQVLMNKSASSNVGSSSSSTGDFNTVLFDINPSETSDGYPLTWTNYEYTFSGLSGKMDTRIAFRHYISHVNLLYYGGVAIDQFKFQAN